MELNVLLIGPLSGVELDDLLYVGQCASDGLVAQDVGVDKVAGLPVGVVVVGGVDGLISDQATWRSSKAVWQGSSRQLSVVHRHKARDLVRQQSIVVGLQPQTEGSSSSRHIAYAHGAQAI